MCNKLHDDSQPIPEEGIAFKIVEHGTTSESEEPSYNSLVAHDHLIAGPNGWVQWNADGFGDGFTMIPGLDEAMRAAESWSKSCPTFFKGFNLMVMEVGYRKGLGCHVEYGFTDEPVSLYIAKEFRFQRVVAKITKAGKAKRCNTVCR